MLEYSVIPTIGKFHVMINDENPDYYYLSVGGEGKNFRCVNISVPKDKAKITGILSYAESKDGCTLDGMKIKGDATKQMLLLGITIARELAPQMTEIELEDMSHFFCKVPDEGDKKVPLHCFFFAFHGKTWYEEKFNAIILNEHLRRKYDEAKMNLYDSSKKPEHFYFANNSLNNELQPLFQESTSWNDFFKKIDIKYGKNKCIVVYPWLRQVLLTYIFNNNLFIEGLKWVIHLNAENTPAINYYQVENKEKQMGGATNNFHHNTYNEQHMFHPKMRDWNYKKLLSNKTKRNRRNKRYTRKNSVV